MYGTETYEKPQHWIIYLNDLLKSADSFRNEASNWLYKWVTESFTQNPDSFGDKTQTFYLYNFFFLNALCWCLGKEETKQKYR